MEQPQKYMEIAACMVNTAREKGYLKESLTVIPELAETEKNLFVMMSSRIGEYAQIRATPELNQDEIHALFVFTLAKAAEAVCCWRCHNEFEPDSRGMFDGNVPLQVDADLMKPLRRLPLADDMYDAFTVWSAEHPEFCTEYGFHPLLPLLEALKWTFRVSAGLMVEFFEKRQH